MKRVEFAERISAGLAGWFQQLAAQGLEQQVGEDAARVELVRMISALRAFVPETSVRPTNWPVHTKKRIDIGVLGRREGAAGWYGAIELKWPRDSVDLAATRQRLVEDAVRVAFSDTANLCANFVVLGGTSSALASLFDAPHPQAKDKEAQRKAFAKLFRRNPKDSVGKLENSVLSDSFPDFADRVPQTVFNGWARRLRTELVTLAHARVGSAERGVVYIWQCKK
ncbi:MAG: hypothetical protein R3B13_38025 [Polyangiaceae bacterium]